MKPIQFAIFAILAAVAGVKAAAITDDTIQICQQTCYAEEPTCSEGMHPVKDGDCWTCQRTIWLVTSLPWAHYRDPPLTGGVLIFLCNPLTTPLPTLIFNTQHILRRPDTILVLTAPSASGHALDCISKELAAANCTPRKILAVDPIRALEAVSTLKSDPSSSAVIQRYQDDFMGSRISFLGDVLARMLGLKDSTRMVSSSSLLLAIRARSAVIQMLCALYTSARSVSQARIAIDRVFTGASELELQVEEVRVRTDREVLVESGIDDNQHWNRLTKISRFEYHDTERVFDKKTRHHSRVQ
ncbi:hypothetical protein BD769DRAFT_1669339 [Suillus cothurnatus]|nr:hypothetical protein BD769DRAFT_1669339 [Suillus cothurnatus]